MYMSVLSVCMYVCVPYEPGTPRGQRKLLDSLKLDGVRNSCELLDIETGLRSSVGATSALNHRIISLAAEYFS